MNAHHAFFGCKHPIVCAPMNQVSDARLAIAVHEAGAFPSLSIPNYVRDGRFDMTAYLSDLRTYKEATGSDQLLLSVGGAWLLRPTIVQPFLKFGFRHIELFHWASTDPSWPAVRDRSHDLAQEHGVRFIFKTSTGHLSDTLAYPTILLKGPEGAGRSVAQALPLDEAFMYCRRHLPATAVIVSGGIHCAAQVRDYLDRGALAVAIGSLFAAARESSVSDSVKRKIIASGANELQERGPLRLRGLFASVAEGDNANLTKTLASGVRDADQGGIFIGGAIDHITEILSVREIVDSLVADADPPQAASS